MPRIERRRHRARRDKHRPIRAPDSSRRTRSAARLRPSQPVDAPDELDIARAPRRVGPHATACICGSPAASPDRPTTAADARSATAARDIVEVRNLPLASVQRIEQGFAVEPRRVVMNLQRPDPRRKIQNAGQLRRAQLRSSRACTRKRKFKIEHIGSVLDEQRSRSPSRAGKPRRGAVPQPIGDQLSALIGTPEANQVARPQLPDLPQLGLHDRGRTNESAQARPIRPENHRHVAREIHRPDGVRVVVNVRRMQTGLAAIRRAQCGFGPISRTPVRSEL